MNNKIALTLENVAISYRITKAVSLKNLIRNKNTGGKYFKAVQNVSLEVYEGEIIGIIGKNGCGKSTLLRAIANIYKPDNGRIDVYGHSVGLMAIGIGFVKELSGRENIYLSGFLMGLSKKEIDEVVDRVIEFSELGRFIDEPVESYSSGMHSKLAFSISTQMETDILLVDETLSVGDRKFKKKSREKMDELIHDQNKTVLIVSHSIDLLRSMCNRVLWMDAGEVRMIGDPNTVLDAYEEYMDRL